ncbi:MAG: carboxymuconolactone decarboxylase family protein [Candidatus Binatia bacterium]
MLIGVVAMMRPCDPCVECRLADARKAGMTEEELDTMVDVIAVMDAGVPQSLNLRIKQRKKMQLPPRVGLPSGLQTR